MNTRTLIEQMLEALELSFPRFGVATAKYSDAVHAARQWLAEPSDPVGYFICPTGSGWHEVASQYAGDKDVYPLFTHPESKPAPLPELTDEEMLDCLKSIDQETKRLPPGFRQFARAILAVARGKAK